MLLVSLARGGPWTARYWSSDGNVSKSYGLCMQAPQKRSFEVYSPGP